MSELAVKLQQDLEKKFDHLCFVHDQTALHVANEFYELRNQIDIAAEELLARQKEIQNDDELMSDVKPSTSKQEIKGALREFKKKHKRKLSKKNKTRSSNKKVIEDLQLLLGKLDKRTFDDADEDVNVNEIRDEYIKILRELEQRCLHQLPKTKRPSSAVTYCHFKQRIESLNECQSDLLEDTYKDLALELIEETHQLEKRLLGEETVFYVSSSKENQLGHLVHIGGDRLRRHEVDCLRNLPQRPGLFPLLEIPLQKHLLACLKRLVLVEFTPDIIVDNNYMIMIRFVFHLNKGQNASTSKYIYIGKPELQYSDNSGKKCIIERQFVAYRLPFMLENLELKHIAGISCDLGVLCFIRSELIITESRLANLDFLASSHANRLEILALKKIRLERFDANLFSNCVNLNKLKIDIYGECAAFTSLEFLRPLTNLATLDLSLPNFDIDLSVLQDYQCLTTLTLSSARDSTGELTYSKMNVDVVLRQLCGLSSLTDLHFVRVEIETISKRQFADFKTLQKVTFRDTRGCTEATDTGDIHESTSTLSALSIKFINFDLNVFEQLLNLFGY